MGGVDDEVWYASYGSNMWWPRFRCYLEGGVPPGATSTHVHDGARDSSSPSDSRLVRIPYRMYFARSAAAWDGRGVSFLDHVRIDPDDGAWGRAWRISKEQFDDVVAQENRLRPGELSVALDGLDPGDTREVTDGWYGRLVVVDVLDDLPLVTFTSPRPMAGAAMNAPAGAYLRTLVLGLLEAADLDADHRDAASLDPAAIGEHLAAAPGAAGHWTSSEIAALL